MLENYVDNRVGYLCKLWKVRGSADHAHISPLGANALYLSGVLQAHRVMAKFVKTNFRKHPMLSPKTIMFLFETSFPQSEIDHVCAMVNSVRTLLRDMEYILHNLNLVKIRMDTIEDRLSALE